MQNSVLDGMEYTKKSKINSRNLSSVWIVNKQNNLQCCMYIVYDGYSNAYK